MPSLSRPRDRFRSWLSRHGIRLERVTYRTEVPQEPFAVQRILLERAGALQPVIFDLGANRGDVTATYRAMFPGAEIHCFEPHPDTYRSLSHRFTGDEGIHPHPLAVSDRCGDSQLHLTAFDQTHSLLPREKSGRRYFQAWLGNTGETLPVKTTTLDEFCAGQGIEHVDVLKLDIQGGELAALLGARELLARNAFSLVFSECALIRHYESEGLLHQVTALLESFGMDLFDLYHLYRARNGQLRYCEALFVSREVRRRVLDRFPPEI